MTNQISTVIIDTEAQSTELLKLYLNELDFVQVTGEFSDLKDGYNNIIETRPNIAIIDVSKKTEQALEIINKISTQTNCKILAISSNYSPELIIKIMRSGAKDFLQKPVIKTALVNTLNKFIEKTSECKKCRVITTFSNKGGIGKTSIATNLAIELANITKEKVALIDLNLQMGDITTFLDLRPAFDTAYVMQNLSKTDEEFLLSTLEKYKDTNLYVLADPPYWEQAKDITAEQIKKLLSALKQTFSYIVLDTSANFDDKTITALDNSDLILLITIVNLPAIRNCQRCLDLFERLGYDKEKTKIILNRYMENDEITTEDVEVALKRKAYWKIPNNYFTLISAINKGVPVSTINSESNIAQSYRELAAMLSDDIYEQNFAQNISRKPSFNFVDLFK